MFITGFFAFQLQYLTPDFEFEKFFPTNDPDIDFYEDHRSAFGYDNDYLLLVVRNTNGIFERRFLSGIKQLTDSLQKYRDTRQVVSPVNFKHLVAGPLGVIPFPLIHLDEPEKYGEDSTRIYSHPLYRSFVSSDGNSLLIQVIHGHLEDPQASGLLVSNIEQLLNSYPFDESFVIGKLVAQREFISLIQKDFVYFLVAALLISFLLLAYIFRSIKVALLPYAISLTALVWLLGLMGWTGSPVTIVGSLIPPVILFVSSSDAIHLLNAYRNASDQDPFERLKAAVRKVILPTFLTSITTAIGFFSLLTMSTDPIRNLGIFTGLGVLFAFIITFGFGPLLVGGAYRRANRTDYHPKLVLWMLQHQRAIVFASVFIVTGSIYGVSQLQTDAYLLKDLPDSSPTRQHFSVVDAQFGGSKPWELAYWPADSTTTIWHPKVMKEANKIHDYLQNQYPIERLWSPVSLINYGNQMIHGGNTSFYQLPDPAQYNRASRVIGQFTNRNALPKLITKEENYARFAGFIPQMGSRKTIQKDRELKNFIRSSIDPSVLHTRLTGTTYLIDKSHALLSQNLLKGLLLAIGVIALVLGLYFRSVKILIISSIINIIPLLFTAGFMGITGISLQLTTSIIFAVAFGIAVDDTIHLVTMYLQEKRNSSNRVLVLMRTFRSAGQAIIITTLVIIAGFGLFIFSSFGATFYLGLFMSLALAVALITDLLLLPILLHHFSGNKSPNS